MRILLIRSLLFSTALLAWANPASAGAPGAALDLYVSSPGTDEILQFDVSTGSLVGAFVSAGAGGLDVPTGLAFGPNGNLFVLSQGTDAIGDDAILEFDGTTGAFVGAFHPGSSELLWNEHGAGELTWGGNGHLFVSNWVDQFGPPLTFPAEAVEFDGADGSVVRVYQSFEVCVWRPYALALDAANKVFLTSLNAPRQHVYAYDGTTGACDSSSIDDPFASISEPSDGIEFGPNGNLFVTRRISSDVLEFDGSTGALVRTVVPSGSAGLDTPGDLKFGPNENLFVVNGDGRIFEYNGTDGSSVRILSNVPLPGAQFGRVRLAFKPAPLCGNQSEALQCANDLSTAEAALGQCQIEYSDLALSLASCDTGLEQAQTAFAGAQVQIAQLQNDIASRDVTIAQREADLVADEDQDGVINLADDCPDTNAGSVDRFGCSILQFCADFAPVDGDTLPCKNADWLADEPLVAPKDCKAKLLQCVPKKKM